MNDYDNYTETANQKEAFSYPVKSSLWYIQSKRSFYFLMNIWVDHVQSRAAEKKLPELTGPFMIYNYQQMYWLLYQDKINIHASMINARAEGQSIPTFTSCWTEPHRGPIMFLCWLDIRAEQIDMLPAYVLFLFGVILQLGFAYFFISTRSEPPGLHVFGPWEEKAHTAHRTAPVMELANIKSKSFSNYVERQQMQPSEPTYLTLNSSRIIPGSPGNSSVLRARSVLLAV